MAVICFLFPAPALRPAGGYKMIFEYANRLVKDGYNVKIVYSGSIYWSKKNLKFKISGIYRYIEKFFKGYSSRKWFPLDKRIKEYLSFSLNQRHVPESDIYICTTPITAQYLNEYNISSKNKFYYIQGYENWGGFSDKNLIETYKYNIKKLIVSNWLTKLINNYDNKTSTILNGFDLKKYKCNIAPSKRNPHNLSLIYSPIPLKGFKYAWDTLNFVKKKIPELHVDLFGVEKPNFELQNWITFHFCPELRKINEIYNNSSIFMATSLQEGWGLTIGEAMLCGATVVCTGNKGYLEMAKHERNALVSPVGDSKAMADNIIRLIEDNELRIKLAEQGNKDIQNFNIEDSYLKFKNALGLS